METRGIVRDDESYTKRELRAILDIGADALNDWLRDLGIDPAGPRRKAFVVPGRVINERLVEQFSRDRMTPPT